MLKSPQILSALRQKMAELKVHAFLVPSGDAHQSEYIAACDGRRAFVSGFTGSTGYAVVTLDQAALWTDGRYFLQASTQLDSNWKLMKMGLPETPERTAWLNKILPPKSSVGFDPRLLSVDEVLGMRKGLAERGHSMVPLRENLVDLVWPDKPATPTEPVVLLDLKYAGQPYAEKLKQVRQAISSHKDNKGYLVTALDEVGWLFNLRGSDIPYNPVFFSFALVTQTSSVLFTNSSRLSVTARQFLKAEGVELQEYQSVYSYLTSFGTSFEPGAKLLTSGTCNYSVAVALGRDELVENILSPIQKLKAIKNSVELQGFRNCHLRDAAALCNYFGWLKNELCVKGNLSISEVDAADKAEHFRSLQADFVGLSFDTISSTGANGAIIHYKPEKDTCSIIDKNKVYLCDSGAQYLDGTTDVTRTFHFGTPTAFEKLAFTRVLQGHIALDSVVFPHGTTGYVLDPVARQPLWKSGLDYRHGTGHGVGSYLNVHEGPQGIGFRKPYDNFPLEENMTVTNEPGYYHDGSFGIRIENVLIVKKQKTPHNFDDKVYLGFEHVTLVPIGLGLIDVQLLSAAEKAWINAYHAECWDKVSPLLEEGSLGYSWLKSEVSPLPL